MKTSIATVSLSGSLTEKLHACAAAGFDGVEIFEPDLIANDHSPEEIRALSSRLGLSLDLYQPLRDIEGVDEDTFADNLRRAGATFATAQRLGIDTMLVCSNVGTATVDSDEVSADQLRRLGDLAAAIRHQGRVRGAGLGPVRRRLPAGVAHRSSSPTTRTSGSASTASTCCPAATTPRRSRTFPADKIFFLQLADAPALSMDVLSWSRHHRLFPGEGAFDLPAFVSHVLATGYDGPLSLEVFNDTFRQTDPDRTAVHALRSLLWLQDRTAALGPEGWRRDLRHPHRGQAAYRLRLRRGQGGGHQRGRGAAGPARLHAERAAPHQAGVAVVGRRCPCRAQRTAGARPGSARRGRRTAGARRGRHLAPRGRTDGAGGLPQDLRHRTGSARGRRTRRHRDVLGQPTPTMGRRVRERSRRRADAGAAASTTSTWRSPGRPSTTRCCSSPACSASRPTPRPRCRGRTGWCAASRCAPPTTRCGWC